MGEGGLVRIAVVAPEDRRLASILGRVLRPEAGTHAVVEVTAHVDSGPPPDLGTVDGVVISTHTAECEWGEAEMVTWLEQRIDDGVALFAMTSGPASPALLEMLRRAHLPLRPMPCPGSELRSWAAAELLHPRGLDVGW